MVDLLSSPTSKEGKEDVRNQTLRELNKQNNPVSSSLTDPEVSFADSLLDFDFIEDWIEEVPESYDIMASDDLRENPVGFSGGKVEVDVFEKGSDGFREKSEVEEKGTMLGCLQEKVEPGLGEKVIETVGDMLLEKISVQEWPVRDGEGMSGDLGCLIEKEMGKVSLDRVCSGSFETVGGVSGIMNGGGISSDVSGVKSDGAEHGSVDTMQSHGVMSSDGNIMQSSGVQSSTGEAGEIVIDEGNGVQGHEQGNDDAESESDSEFENESERSSSSSSSSSDDSDDTREEEDKDKKEKGKKGSRMHGEGKKDSKKGQLEGEMDIEEGQIMQSDADEMVAWSGDEYDEDDGNGGIAPGGPVRSKNELAVLPPVPPVEVTLQPHHRTLPVGSVLSIIGSQVIVEGVEKHNPLDEGSILWITQSRSPLGLVDEIFGPVKNPYYIVRYNSEGEVPTGIQPGTSISFVPEFANHVLNDKSLYQKGYDASGANDEEILEEDEFSDDEKEAEYRKMLKLKKRGTGDEKMDNKKKDRRKFKNRSADRNCDQAANKQIFSRQAKPPPTDRSKNLVPHVASPQNQGSGLSSPGLGQGLALQPGTSLIGQLGIRPSINTPSGGAQAFSFQQPQSMGFPGLVTSAMSWVQQVHPQPPYQMPLQNGVPFQPQIDDSSSFPSNPVVSGGPSGFGAAPAFLGWHACLGPNMFNPPPFGMVPLSQQAPLPINVGEHAVASNMSMGGSGQPHAAISGKHDSSPNFNRGNYSGAGRNSHRRHGGRGRFRSGRGRQ